MKGKYLIYYKEKILNDMMVNMYYQILILWGQNLTDHLIYIIKYVLFYYYKIVTYINIIYFNIYLYRTEKELKRNFK